jgi:hypothetical protein
MPDRRLAEAGGPRDSARVKRLAVLLLAAGCGSDPDPAPSLGCQMLGEVVAFDSADDFAPAVAGSLAGWDPEGRWFLVGAPQIGAGSVLLQRSGSQVIVDRLIESPGRIDGTEIFERAELQSGDASVIVANRITNLAADGTARLQRGQCVDGRCVICTAQMVRAGHNAGESEGQGISLVGQLRDPSWGPGYTLNVRVDGTIAYLIRQHDLRIIETADPAHPVEIGHYAPSATRYSNDVKLVAAGARRFALIADSPSDVVDVTDPGAPQLVAQIPINAHTLFTETRDGKTLAYFGGYDGTCPVYDVTDPTAPALLGSFNAGGSLVHDLSVQDGIAYLNAWERGFLVVDFTNPAVPRLLGRLTPTSIGRSHSNWTTMAGGRRIALHGEEGYGAKLHVVDVDPASPTFMRAIAEWGTRPWISIHNIMAFGSKSYLTYYQDGVRVLDVSDPVHPTQIGYYNTWDPAADYATAAFFESAVGLDVDPSRKLIFVADSPRGLLILRDDTP